MIREQDEKKPSVHKDFHGAFSYGLQHLYDHFGMEAVDEYLRRVGTRCYADLIERIREHGLPALEEHLRAIFELEEADFELGYEGETLVLRVHRCPALSHMQKTGYAIFHDYCRHTRVVNEAMCDAAGLETSTESDQTAMKCVQKFWKKANAT